KPSVRTLLRRQVERVLKTADLFSRVVSLFRHSRIRPAVHASPQQGSFPRAELCCLGPPSVLRPHPPPSWPTLTSRGSPVIERLTPAVAGPGRASPVPLLTFCTFRSLYPGGFLEVASPS